eukprot:COSAG02_NODE_12222_length_1577_cov_1.075051_2_plen_137_part_00
MDAMSDAIEGADVMLYGVSLRYKESANVRKAPTTVLSVGLSTAAVTLADILFVSLHCASQCRLEANYAYQQELDMVPLMVQQDYRPQGWCKSEYGALCCCCAAVVMSLTCGNDVDRSGFDPRFAYVVRDVGCREGR